MEGLTHLDSETSKYYSYSITGLPIEPIKFLDFQAKIELLIYKNSLKLQGIVIAQESIYFEASEPKWVNCNDI